MGGWKKSPLRNFAWQGVWGAALEFSSCFCMGRCSKILLRFGWYPLPSPLGSFCVPPPFWLVGVHGGQQFLQQSPPCWPWSWPTPSTNRSNLFLSESPVVAGKMFAHSVRVVSTPYAAPICHMVILFLCWPILPIIRNFPIYPFLGGSLLEPMGSARPDGLPLRILCGWLAFGNLLRGCLGL